MANNGSMIYGQVAMTDIQAVLPTFYSDLLNIFSIHGGRFNKWARWKPIVWAWQFNPRTDMWRGPDGQCGMTIKKYGAVGGINTQGTFLYDITHNLCEWVYIVPNGGESAPMRMGDFGQWLGEKPGNLGYINYAVSPFGSPDIEMLPNANGDIDFPFEEPDVDDSGNGYTAPEYRDPTTLSPNLDILDFAFNGVWAGEFYFGIALSSGLVFTGSTKIKDGGMGQVTAKNIHLAAGTYTCFPFLSSYSRPYGASEQTGTLIPLDNWSFKLRVKSQEESSVVVWAYGSVNSKGKVTAYVIIDNNTNGSVTVSNIKVQFMRGKTFGGSGDLFDSILCSPSSITIPAGGSATTNEVHTTIPYPPSDLPEYWVRGALTSSYARVVYKDMPLDEEDDEGGGSDVAPN